MEDLQLGSKIQALRAEKGLSVRRLAALAGITPSMLSQIENEQVNPSINTLRAVAGALDTPLYALFSTEPAEDPVVRGDRRRIIGSKSEPDVYYELLTGDTKGDIEFCMMVLPAGKSSFRDQMSHIGEEAAYLLTGKCVELEMNGTVYTLYPGDSVRIRPKIPHVWHNRSDETVKVIFAVTPPTF